MTGFKVIAAAVLLAVSLARADVAIDPIDIDGVACLRISGSLPLPPEGRPIAAFLALDVEIDGEPDDALGAFILSAARWEAGMTALDMGVQAFEMVSAGPAEHLLLNITGQIEGDDDVAFFDVVIGDVVSDAVVTGIHVEPDKALDALRVAFGPLNERSHEPRRRVDDRRPSVSTLQRVRVFPNPIGSRGNIRVVLPEEKRRGEDADFIRVSVYDVRGRRVIDRRVRMHGDARHVRVDGRTLPAGVYVVEGKYRGRLEWKQKITIVR